MRTALMACIVLLVAGCTNNPVDSLTNATPSSTPTSVGVPTLAIQGEPAATACAYLADPRSYEQQWRDFTVTGTQRSERLAQSIADYLSARSHDLDLQAYAAFAKRTGEFDKFGRLAGQARDTSAAAAALAGQYRQAMNDGQATSSEIDETIDLFFDLLETVGVLGDVCGTPIDEPFVISAPSSTSL